MIETILASARESAPWPDGLPYYAWRASGVRGAATLHAVLVHLADGGDVPLWFNDSDGVFGAKGDEEFDHLEVTRAAQDTRPLGLKNCDNKTVGGTVNMADNQPFPRAPSGYSEGLCLTGSSSETSWTSTPLRASLETGAMRISIPRCCPNHHSITNQKEEKSPITLHCQVLRWCGPSLAAFAP